MPVPETTACKHESAAALVSFNEAEARKILDGWEPKSEVDFIMGNPAHAEVRRRWPRFMGPCPDCRASLILYASDAHYLLGDW